jgi:hypothetical protein
MRSSSPRMSSVSVFELLLLLELEEEEEVDKE